MHGSVAVAWFRRSSDSSVGGVFDGCAEGMQRLARRSAHRPCSSARRDVTQRSWSGSALRALVEDRADKIEARAGSKQRRGARWVVGGRDFHEIDAHNLKPPGDLTQ